MSIKNGKILVCRVCNKSRYIKRSRLKNFRYCSYKCAGVSKRGIVPLMAFKVRDKRITGEGNYQWKGDNAGYIAKHRWIKKWYGEPKLCESCGIKNKKYNWANISGKYKRDINDWKQLCISCHRKYDNHGEKSRITWHKNNDNNLSLKR